MKPIDFDQRRMASIDSGDLVGAFRADLRLHGYSRLSSAELKQAYVPIIAGLAAQDALGKKGQMVVWDAPGGARLSGDGPGGQVFWSDETCALLAIAKKGKKAEGEVAAASVGLVQTIAKRYHDRGLGFDDSVGAGTVGLLRGVSKYDPSSGKNFTTVVGGWIMNEMNRAVREARGSGIHIPEHLRPVEDRLFAIHSQFLQDTGREPVAAELVGLLGDGTTEDVVTGLLRHMFGGVTSLDGMNEEDDGSVSEAKEYLDDPESQEPFRRTVFDETLDATTIGAHLTEQQTRAVRIKLENLRGGEEMDGPVAQTLGVRRQRVGQLLGAAGRQVRKNLPDSEADLLACAA